MAKREEPLFFLHLLSECPKFRVCSPGVGAGIWVWELVWVEGREALTEVAKGPRLLASGASVKEPQGVGGQCGLLPRRPFDLETFASIVFRSLYFV